jgi:hypothetical protein
MTKRKFPVSLGRNGDVVCQVVRIGDLAGSTLLFIGHIRTDMFF